MWNTYWGNFDLYFVSEQEKQFIFCYCSIVSLFCISQLVSPITLHFWTLPVWIVSSWSLHHLHNVHCKSPMCCDQTLYGTSLKTNLYILLRILLHGEWLLVAVRHLNHSFISIAAPNSSSHLWTASVGGIIMMETIILQMFLLTHFRLSSLSMRKFCTSSAVSGLSFRMFFHGPGMD